MKYYEFIRLPGYQLHGEPDSWVSCKKGRTYWFENLTNPKTSFDSMLTTREQLTKNYLSSYKWEEITEEDYIIRKLTGGKRTLKDG